MSKNNTEERRGGGWIALHITGLIIKWIFILLFTIILGAAITAYFFYGYAKTYINDVIEPQAKEAQQTLDLTAYNPELSSTIYYYDTERQEYVEWETLFAGENRVWVEYDNIPENLINATVAIEDQRYWEHAGVDWKRTLGAVYYMFTGGNVQGGSTITQQLIKNLSDNDAVTVKRKVLEIFSALEFSKKHSKEETLELYLNNIYLGRRCNGIYTASYKYFGKDVSELDLAQCACLISITNNPSLYDPYNHQDFNLKRAHIVLIEMCKQGYITEKEMLKSLAEIGWFPDGEDEEGNKLYKYDENKVSIVFTDGSLLGTVGLTTSPDQIRNWYADAVIESVLDDLMEQYGYTKEAANNILFCGGLSIYTCYDPKVQSMVDETYQDSSLLAEYSSNKGQPLQSSIAVVDNSTGAVVALSQFGEKVNNRAWVQATDSLRQPGSSIKPIAVYAPALEEKLITPYSAVNDSPFKEVNGNPWPQNASHSYSGWTDIYTAVIKSLNTCAVKTLDLLGVDKSYDYLENKFGISSLVSYMDGTNGRVLSDIDYAPLALGGLTEGVSTFEMAGAYSTFPRNGSFIEPHLYSKVVDSEGNILLENDESGTQILSENTCYYMNQMLVGVVEEGTGKNAQINGMTVAGKTGTTTNNYDRWFCGYTGYYTAAVWIGYDNSEKIQFPGNPAVTLWKSVMERLVDGKADVNFVHTDKEIVTATVCSRSGLLASSACSAAGAARTGSFIEGDAPTDYCEWHIKYAVCKGDGEGKYYKPTQYCPEDLLEYHVIFKSPNEDDEGYIEFEDTENDFKLSGYCPYHTAEWYENKDLWGEQIITVPSGIIQGYVGTGASLGAVCNDLAGNPGGALTFESSNPEVATVSDTGYVSIVGEGSASITITAAKTPYAPSVNITVTVVGQVEIVPPDPQPEPDFPVEEPDDPVIEE